MVKLAKAAKKGKGALPPPKEEHSEDDDLSEEEEGSEEEETPPKKAKKGKKGSTPAKNTTPAKAAKNGKKAKKQEIEEDDDEDEDDSGESEEEMPTPKKKKKALAKAKQDSEEEEEEEEEEQPAPKKKKKALAKAKQEESEEEEEDEDEEEKPAPKKKKKAAKQESAPKKKAKAKQESEEEEDGDSEDEAMDTTPVVEKGKKAKEEESSDDEEESEESEDEDEEKEPVKEKPAKRKKEMPQQKAASAPKKQKTEKDGFSLFVGNLRHTKNQDELIAALTQFFSTYDLTVTDVRIGSSKKFGYVDFASEEELEKALELTGKEIMGKEIKLDKALSKEATIENKKERDARTLFVKNLPFSVVEEDLQDVFDSALEIRMPLNREGSSRGIAYVEFKTEAEADKALEEKQGTDVKGRAMVLDFTGMKSQNVSYRREINQPESKTIVVNNLAYAATEEILQEMFEKASSIRIPQKNGRPKGYAFMDFETIEDAKEALETYNNTEIEGRTVRLEYSQTDKSGSFRPGPTKTLFVKGLSPSTTEETLRDSFENAVGARVATDRDTGASKGFGFVDFTTEEEAKAAKEAMEDGEIDGSKVTLDYAKPKGENQGKFYSHGGFRGSRGRRFRGGRGGGGGGGGRGFGGRGGGGGFKGKNDTQKGKKIKFDD